MVINSTPIPNHNVSSPHPISGPLMYISSMHAFPLFLLAVIKMEGGGENDLRILELPNEEEEERERERERLSSGGPGSEPPKRDEPRPVDVERKPSVEKDKMVSECFIMEQRIMQYLEER